VFSLLKSPLISSDYHCDPDFWSYLQCLYSGLSPRFIHKALYPVLSSYGAANNLASQHLCLSRASVLTSGCKLFLIDAFSLIIIYFIETPENKNDIAFPPPKDSLIRNTVNNLKKERHTTPNVMFIKNGTAEEPFFDMLLIEEQTKFGTTYSQFLENIQSEVAKLPPRN